LHALRIAVSEQSAELGKAQFGTLQLRLLKVAALVESHPDRLPRSPFVTVFRDHAARLDLAPAPT